MKTAFITLLALTPATSILATAYHSPVLMVVSLICFAALFTIALIKSI